MSTDALAKGQRPFWVSFWDSPEHLKTFEYSGPWWISGMRGAFDDESDTQESIVAAVMAEDEQDARRVINQAYDGKDGPLEWRFVTPKPADWRPLLNESGRFPPKPWMKWPWPTPLASKGEEKNR